MQFNDPQSTDEVRASLEQAFDKNITVEELSSSGQIAKGTYFRLRVANEKGENADPQVVEDRVSKAFPGKLVHKKLSIGPVQAIAVPAPPKEGEPAPSNERFAGGREVVLSFSDDKARPVDIAPTTFSRLFEKQLDAITVDGK